MSFDAGAHLTFQDVAIDSKESPSVMEIHLKASAISYTVFFFLFSIEPDGTMKRFPMDDLILCVWRE